MLFGAELQRAMTYSILIVAYRKPDLTPEEFRDYYNDRHVPLIREITGEYVPNTAIIHTHPWQAPHGIVFIGMRHALCNTIHPRS